MGTVRSVNADADRVRKAPSPPGEELTNPGGAAALRHGGLQLVPIRLDDQGLDVDELATAAARVDLRAVFVTPHHQFPTTTVMPSARRLMLLEVAHQHGMILVEDDYDHEYHYEGRPVPPLASLDRHGSVSSTSGPCQRSWLRGFESATSAPTRWWSAGWRRCEP